MKLSKRLSSGFTYAEYEGESTFLGGSRIEFASGFTAITGESGVGKSTLVETVAYAVRPGESPSAATRKLVQSNLKGGCVRLGWRNEYGAEYTIVREPSRPARMFDAEGREIGVPVEQLVRAEFYSTHALQEIACDSSAQLELLDRFVGDEMGEIKRAIEATAGLLRDNASKLLEVSRSASSHRTEADFAAGAEERLKSMQPQHGADAAALQGEMIAKGLREREKEAFTLGRAAVHTAQKAVREMAGQTKRQLSAVVDDALLAGRNGVAMRALSGQLRRVGDALETTLAEVGRSCDLADADIGKDEKALEVVHHQQQQAYEKLLASNKEAQEKEGERSAAQKQLAKALTARKSYELRQTERKQLEELRREQLLRLSTLLDRRYELRKAVAQNLSDTLGPNIKVAVSRAADNDVYEEVLAAGLANATREELARERVGLARSEGKPKGSNMRVADVAAKLAKELTPQQLVAAVRRNDADWLCDRTGLDPERAGKVIARLEDTETLYELEMLEPLDQPSIQLKDGDYKDVDSVSTGQKAAVLLPIILLQGKHPIILDQPEEGLFARFKATTVASILREVKTRRQVILVTHDPNLVVLPVADRVNELASHEGRGYLKSTGAMAAQRDAVINVLDGGDEAFLTRTEFYGHDRR